MATTKTEPKCSSSSSTGSKSRKSSATSRQCPSYYKDTLSSARKKVQPMPRSRPPTTSTYTYSGLLCAPRREKDDTCSSSSLWQERSTPSKHSRICSTCHPSASLVRPSDAVGLDPSSTLAKRLTYSTQSKKKSDPLPPHLREYFMYKSQTYTWRRVRLMREIKAYLASNITIAPEYRILWCENGQSRAQMAQNFSLDDSNDDWLKSDLVRVTTQEQPK